MGSGGSNTSALNRLCEELVSQSRFANRCVTLMDWSAFLDIDALGMTKLACFSLRFPFGPHRLKSKEHSLAFVLSSPSFRNIS